MHIKAKHFVQSVTASMIYSSDISKGFYDACYYEIGTFPLEHLEQHFEKDTEELYGLRLHLKITKMKNMNVYLYGGHTRETATIKIVSSNE